MYTHNNCKLISQKHPNQSSCLEGASEGVRGVGREGDTKSLRPHPQAG